MLFRSCPSSFDLSGEPYEVLVPTSETLGLVVKSSKSWSRAGPQILKVKQTSPLYNIVQEGDYIMSVDGMDARNLTARELSQWLHRHDPDAGAERTLILISRSLSYGQPYGNADDDSNVV